MKFIKIIDNTGDCYYINPSVIAYLKSSSPLAGVAATQVRVNKVVLKNDKHIIVPSASDFAIIKSYLWGESHE